MPYLPVQPGPDGQPTHDPILPTRSYQHTGLCAEFPAVYDAWPGRWVAMVEATELAPSLSAVMSSSVHARPRACNAHANLPLFFAVSHNMIAQAPQVKASLNLKSKIPV